MIYSTQKTNLPTPDEALPGRDIPMSVTNRHYVSGHPILPPFPSHLHSALFGLGCFWGAERKFWQTPGVFTTAVGYSGGYTPNPTYDEVCTGQTGHAEVVKVVFDPVGVSYEHLLRLFWESHNPTQGMRQGNDIGTQYRSGIYFYSPGQEQAALPLVRADELVGKKDSEITELLGKPSLVRRDRQARIWQYRGATCVLDLFLYPPADKKNSDAQQEGARAVVYFETRSKNAEAVSNDRCISEVVSARAGAG